MFVKSCKPEKYLQYSEFIRDLKFIKQLVITEAFTSARASIVRGSSPTGANIDYISL